MNIFICNRYDSKSEDIYIITSHMPDDKDKIYYYKYDSKKNIYIRKTYHILREESQDNNISQNNEESDELQIIDYPYQPQEINNDLNIYNSNKSKMSNSYISNNTQYFNCFSKTNITKDNSGKNRVIHNFNRKKHSFSCLSSSNYENTINNKISLESSDIDDTIKGEDHFNISKFKMRIKNLENKNNININTNISNNIFNKNKIKSSFLNNLINKNNLDINKNKTQKASNSKKKLNKNNSNKKINNIKNLKNEKYSKTQKKEITNPTNNKYDKLNIYKNINSKKNLKSNIKGDLSLNYDYKKNNLLFELNNNKIRYNTKNNRKSNSINKNYSDDNIFISGYNKKENDNKIYNKDNKKSNYNFKKKIKKGLITQNSSKDKKPIEKRKK